MKIIILGGGVAGCGTAIELANRGYEVEIVEMREGLLDGTSDDTPCRFGLGFHYLDEETAKKYLRATIEVAKKYPEFRVAAKEEASHPYKRGRYFITKDTLFPVEQILKLYNELQQEYTKIVEKDSSSKLFGEPKDFYRVLSLNEYQNDVNPALVMLGIETAEQILDWPKLKAYLIEKIENHPNITVQKRACVIDAQYGDKKGFLIKARQDNKLLMLEGDIVINATWENIEKIDEKIGFMYQNGSRTNRTKMLVEIELPEECEKSGPMHSMFFCFGPHCSFTNIGGGRAFVSYEPETNIEQSSDVDPPSFWKALGKNSLALENEINERAKKIVEGASKYIPKLKEFGRIVSKKIGIVKTLGGTADIYSSKSEIHKRSDSGIKVQQIGWIDHGAMKLMYFLENAIKIADIVDEHIKTTEKLKEVSNQCFFPLGENNNRGTLSHMLLLNLQRGIEKTSNENEISTLLEQLKKTVKNKAGLNVQFQKAYLESRGKQCGKTKGNL